MNTVKDYEIDNATGYNHEGAEPNVPVRRLTATTIIGDKVENSHGEHLGRIENLMINIRAASVEYAVIHFGAFLGLSGKLFAVPFSELKIDAEKKLFVLDRDQEYLKKMPGFDQTHWPDTNEHVYYSEVDEYWRGPDMI